MTERERLRDLKLLGLDEPADRAQMIAAHRAKRALYENHNLATYNLYTDEERIQLLEELDRALERLSEPATAYSPTPVQPKSAPRRRSLPSHEPGEPAPDRGAEPGAFLRYRRLLCGLSRTEVAAETKVSEARISALEAEDAVTLPAPVFVRGFVIAIARSLDIDDPEELARALLAKLS